MSIFSELKKKKNGFWVTNYRIYSIEHIFLRLQQSRAASYKLFTFCLWPRWKMAMWKTNSGALLQCGGVPSISCAESWSQEFLVFFFFWWLGVDLHQASLRQNTLLSSSCHREDKFVSLCDKAHLCTHEEKHPHQRDAGVRREPKLYPARLDPGPPQGPSAHRSPICTRLEEPRGTTAGKNPN